MSANLGKQPPLRVGVSACLLGDEVRFDGGHKRNAFLTETLGRLVEFVPVCPELELGLGVPRETLRLERHRDEIHLVGDRSGKDHTAAMGEYAVERVARLAAEALSGYILKKNSPSCGMERVRVYASSGTPARDGRGLFAAALMQHFPNLPVEEEGRLDDVRLRENFIERILAYRRLNTCFAGRWTQGGLIAFHTAHKLTLLAHSPRSYAELGPVVAQGHTSDRAELRSEYSAAFMQALARLSTRALNANVLQHVAGYFRKHLDSAARQELAAVIDDYRRELVPLIAPVTLVRHYTKLFAIDYLRGQTYLEPHPAELMLRDRV